MKQIFTIVLLAACYTALAQKQLKQECMWPQPGYEGINCRTQLVYSAGPDNQHRAAQSEEFQADLSNYTNSMIETRKEFKPLSRYINLDVNWRKEKIAFYTNCTTYKHGKLNSDHILTGISLSADGTTLYLSFRSTFHGVCQGVLQLPEWYSFGIDTYAIVIPNTVEKITRSTCHYGPDCSNIP